MKNKSSYYYFCFYRLFSFIIYIFIFFSYFEVFLESIIKVFSKPFFITDINLFSFELFQRLRFIFWLIYFIFILTSFFYCFVSSFSFNEFNFIFRVYSLFIYTHVISFLINHYDYAKIYSNFFNSNLGFIFEQVDFISFTHQYRGTFHDLNRFLICFYFIILIFCENPKIFYIIFYPFPDNTFFWSVYKKSIIIRILLYFSLFRLFSGDGVFSDSILFYAFIFFFEFYVIYIRQLIILQKYKNRV